MRTLRVIVIPLGTFPPHPVELPLAAMRYPALDLAPTAARGIIMRWIMRVAMALLVFAAILVGAVFLIPAERVAGLAAREFSKLTGRELVISGSVRPSFYPVLGVRTGPISVANADWSDEGPLLSAASMEIALDMQSLIRGDVRITGLMVSDPVIVLERNAEGLANWDFRAASAGGGTAGPDTPGAGTPFTMDRAAISGGTVRYIDHAAGRTLLVEAFEATAQLPDFNGAAQLAASARIAGQDVVLAGAIAEFAAFLAGRLVPVQITAQAGMADMGFDGRISASPLAAEGAVTADLGDMAALFALAGRAAPGLPQGLGAQKVAVSGAVTLTPEGSVHLRDGVISLDGNRLTGDLDLVMAGERPELSAKLVAGELSLAGGAGSGGGGEGAATGGGWSAAPIDVSALGGMDATIALSAAGLDLSAAKIGATKLLMTLERARAVFDLRELAVYGGGITGEFVVNGRSGLSLGGNLRFAGIDLQPMLRGLAGYDRLTGTGDVAVKFLAVGNSEAALMQGLLGSGTLSLTRGEVSGVDVPGMLRTLDTSYVGAGAKTVYDAVTGSFVVDGGVLANDDLVLDAPGLTASGRGTIGIGARDLDYRIRPTALADTAGAGGISVPLLITGTWANPKFRLDLAAIAQEKFEQEKAELAAKAEAALAEKLQQDLGIEALPGENLEDAARRKLEEAIEQEAVKALERLLGGGD